MPLRVLEIRQARAGMSRQLARRRTIAGALSQLRPTAGLMPLPAPSRLLPQTTAFMRCRAVIVDEAAVVVEAMESSAGVVAVEVTFVVASEVIGAVVRATSEVVAVVVDVAVEALVAAEMLVRRALRKSSGFEAYPR